jgi:hypothetical protein
LLPLSSARKGKGKDKREGKSINRKTTDTTDMTDAAAIRREKSAGRQAKAVAVAHPCGAGFSNCPKPVLGTVHRQKSAFTATTSMFRGGHRASLLGQSLSFPAFRGI